MNAKEAKRRQQVIQQTLAGLTELLETGLLQELDPQEEDSLKRLLAIGVHKLGVEL